MAWSVRSRSCRSLYRNATANDPLNPPRISKKCYQTRTKILTKFKFYQALRYVTLEGRRMVKEDRLCKLRKRIYMRLYFSREISIGETKVILKVVKLPRLIRTIFLKIWRSDIDSLLPLLFLKVETTFILAIGLLNGQHCRTKNDKWKHLRWNLQEHIYTNMCFAVHTNIS